ncbi:hypothetical protein [Phnomibacter sp. MR]|uniref:hypothetical protein n=1 Tax=Phnomibacter sp. MR TaxID=3042318 RepID=UPI003A80D402
MDIHQIKKYWTNTDEELYTYKPSQLENPRLLQTTIDFLVNCGLPDSCAPGLSFDECNGTAIPTPNQVFNIDIDELNDYLMIGSNGSGDPVCIDLNNKNEIVYLNHDNDFERVYMNASVKQLTECIIRYKDFHASLNPRFENNTFFRRKFTDEEFSKVCNDFKSIDDKCLVENNCWKAELDYLLWERDNE